MNKIYSLRESETVYQRGINFMFLLENILAFDHATTAKFRTLHFASCAKKTMAEVSNHFYKLGKISGATDFI